jgi:hypothetical protein
MHASRLCSLLVLLRLLSSQVTISDHQLCLPRIIEQNANLVFVDNPALELLVISIVTASLLHNVIDREMFESRVLCEDFAVGGLPYTWRASHYDVWLIAHHVYGVEHSAR